MVGSFLFSECMPRWLQRFLRKPELGVVLYNWLGRQKDKKQLLIIDNSIPWSHCVTPLTLTTNEFTAVLHLISHTSQTFGLWAPNTLPQQKLIPRSQSIVLAHTHTHTFQTFVYSHKQASHQPSPPSFSLYVLFFPFCFSGSKRDSYKWKCQQRSSYPILGTG